MQPKGQQLIGQDAFFATGAPIMAVNPATGEQLEPEYASSGFAEVDRACALAESASVEYRTLSPEKRAEFLETIADKIEAIGDDLIQRGMLESGLPRARLEGERGRTCGQLRLFAAVVREGEWMDVRIDPALPDRKPLPRVDLRQQHIALGPVVVFGASNFPLAFSVAGGDTASALAAGCPVIVKAHAAHPGTSELVGRAVQAAAKQCQMPEGVFSLLFGSGTEIGQALVSDSRVKAVGFTGSRRGGMALLATAQARPQPIPVYAEMSSINPTFLLPEALRSRSQELAEGFIGSLAMGAGQFCTNPGLVIAVRSPDLDDFVSAASKEISAVASQTMLTPGIHDAYLQGVKALSENDRVRLVGNGVASEEPNQCQSALFVTSAEAFMRDQSLQDEVFGACSLVIECDTMEELKEVAEALEGQLTATLQIDDGDVEQAKSLLPTLEDRAGRILVNGWPTGVEVCHAMVHGGPFPATSDARTTSVGSSAIHRFLRPVCYQNLPQALLPEALRDGNPYNVSTLLDGRRRV